MSRTSNPFDPSSLAASGGARVINGTTWIGSHPDLIAGDLRQAPLHGCTVVRRIIDDRGREWRVRHLRWENCHGLLFQCTVRGVRSEVRPVRALLESMTDDELLSALEAAD